MSTTTILAFHIGRGGRFHNQGHLSYIGEGGIDKFTDGLYLQYENEHEFVSRLGFNKSFDGIPCISDCLTDRDLETLEVSYGITEAQLGDYIYTNAVGNPVGLSYDGAQSGIGRIDIDGDYDTTYTQYLDDITADELQAIHAKESYYSAQEIYDELFDLHGYTIIEQVDGTYMAVNEANGWEGNVHEDKEDAANDAIDDLISWV